MCRNVMFNEPSLEVLTKRMILHSNNPWTQMDVMTFLVVMAIHAQGPTLQVGRTVEEIAPQATKVPDEVLVAQNEFLEALIQIHEALGAPKDIVQFLKKQLKNNSVQRTTDIGRKMFPGLSDEAIIQRLRLYRAGACLNGSCV
jgi:predicted O-linked N-acetylglucosamine transferase (SPINDLY family)